jgi:hypothetical protein
VKTLDGLYDYGTIKYKHTSIALPDNFTVVCGVLLGGSVEDLFESDNSYVLVQARRPSAVSQPSIQVEIAATAWTDSIAGLTFSLEAAATFETIPQWIDLYDFDRGRWERVDERNATTEDSVVTLPFGISSERFLESGTGLMKARISYYDPGIASVNWLARIDRAVWTITPR